MQQLAKPSRTLPSTSKGLSEASPAGRPVAASLWPVRSLPPLFLSASHIGILDRLQKLFGLLRPLCGLSEASRQPAGLLRPLCGLSEACLLSSYGLPKATCTVRHFGPASKASRQPGGLLRPLCGLSEACLLSSYGLPKATLGILGRLQKPLGSRQASCGLSVACPKPASSLLMGFRRQR